MPVFSDGKRVASPQKKKLPVIIIAAVFGVLIAAFLVFCLLARSSCGRVLPRTAILGCDVSRMDEAVLRPFLEEALPEAYDSCGFPVLMDGEEVTRISLTDLHQRPDTEAAVELCLSAGHSGSFFRDGAEYLLALLCGRELSPELHYTDSALSSAAAQAAERLDRTAQPLSMRIDEQDLTHLYFRAPSRGITVNKAALETALRTALESGSFTALSCDYTAIPYDESITLATLTEGLTAESKNASYDPETEEIVEAVPGISFDAERTAELLSELPEGEELAVDAEVTLPHVYAAELEQCLFRDVLATYSTRFTGTAERIGNVTLAANAINGTVLNSGDVFSYNEALGERTADKGYREAPAYIAGETVDTVGGGICQTSSTLYAACLLANLEIVSRTAHRYVCSYIPHGMDATVSWPDLDYQFRNCTDYPVKIVTATSGGKVTVTLYGTKTDESYVRITSETLSTTGYQTQYRETEELQPGETEVKQTPYTGYKVNTYRNVYSGTGELLSSTLESVSDYKSRDEIILYGKGGPAPDGAVPAAGIDSGTEETPALSGDGSLGDPF